MEDGNEAHTLNKSRPPHHASPSQGQVVWGGATDIVLEQTGLLEDRLEELLTPALVCHKDKAKGNKCQEGCFELCLYGIREHIIDPFRAWGHFVLSCVFMA